MTKFKSGFTIVIHELMNDSPVPSFARRPDLAAPPRAHARPPRAFELCAISDGARVTDWRGHFAYRPTVGLNKVRNVRILIFIESESEWVRNIPSISIPVCAFPRPPSQGQTEQVVGPHVGSLSARLGEGGWKWDVVYSSPSANEGIMNAIVVTAPAAVLLFRAATPSRETPK